MLMNGCISQKRNSYSDTVYYMVDRKHPLPASYVPEDLVIAPIPFVAAMDDPRCLVRADVYFPLRSLYFSARDEGILLYGVCAYHSYKQQKELYEKSIRMHGLSYTRKYVTPPGMSEHQTGLAIDLSCPSNHYELNENFATTPEGIWLKRNAIRFGFEFSYPLASHLRNGYCYEPWHIRFSCKSERFYGMIDDV